MKKLLTLILGIAVLATLSGLATAEPTTVRGSKSNTSYRVAVDKATPTPSPAKTTTINTSKSNTYRAAVATPTSNAKATTVRGSKSNGSERTGVDKASPKLITGKVSQVGARTFTLKAKGKEYKFALPKGGAQPKVGAIVDVTYAGTLGGAEPAPATNLNASRSNNY